MTADPGFGYDPTTDPRSLHQTVTEEQLEELGKRENELQALANIYHRLKGMFRSKGWADLEVLLKNEVTKAQEALSHDHKINTVESIALVRGQVMAFETLLNFPHTVEMNSQVTQADLKRVQKTRDEAESLARS